MSENHIQSSLPGKPVRRGEDRRKQSPDHDDLYYVDQGAGEPAPAVSESAATLMLWIALMVLAGILLFTLLENMAAGKLRDHHTDFDPDLTGGIVHNLHAARQKSEVLAENGDYAGAMHLLLLQSLDAMRTRLGIPIAVSLTSREIHQKTRLEPVAHSSLGDIIRRVEISWFGNHTPGKAEYAECLASYQTLTRAFERGGPS